MNPVVIYHNPACGTSRNVLALLNEAGLEPHVIEYLKTPPDRDTLLSLVERTGGSVRALLREKGTPYAELGLDDPSISDEQLIDHILEHPILLNRPIVVTAHSVRLCRPSETVLEVIADLAAQDR
jgi:arsenate reductase